MFSCLGLSISLGWITSIFYSLILSKSKWSTRNVFQSIWKLLPDRRTISPTGENTEEPQMVQEHTTGPSFNILVMPHWDSFPSDNASKYLETRALSRKLLLSGFYSGNLVFPPPPSLDRIPPSMQLPNKPHL